MQSDASGIQGDASGSPRIRTVSSTAPCILAKRLRPFCITLACLLALCTSASAVVTRLYPLGDVIRDSDFIVVAQVTAVNAKRRTVTLTPGKALKGKAPWKQMRTVLTGGDDKTQLPVIQQRLPKGRTVIFFGKRQRFALGYTEGTWFRLAEPKRAGDPWQFVHLEPFLRRTFHGTTAQLRDVVASVVAGKAPAPAPDPSAQPGFGSR